MRQEQIFSERRFLLSGTAFALVNFAMARLEGKQPNVGAIIIGAIIFALIAAGLFLAFRPVPEPTDAGTNNSAPPTESASSDANSTANATSESGDNSQNSLTTILTPLPTATQAPTPPSTANSANSASPGDNANNAVAAPAQTPLAEATASATKGAQTNSVSPTPVS